MQAPKHLLQRALLCSCMRGVGSSQMQDNVPEGSLQRFSPQLSAVSLLFCLSHRGTLNFAIGTFSRLSVAALLDASSRLELSFFEASRELSHWLR